VRPDGRYHLVQLAADGGRVVLLDDALKAITDLVDGPDGGLAVGVRLIDTDLWLSRSAAP
jgi:hypothetical protein